MKKKILTFLMFLLLVLAYACEPEETCETKQNCFTREDGSQRCFDVPTNCVNNNFGY